MLKKQISKSGLWNYFNFISRSFFAILIGIIFSRSLDVKEFGYFTYASIVINFLNQIVEIGTPQFIIQRYKFDIKFFHTSFTITLILSILLFLIINFATFIPFNILGLYEIKTNIRINMISIHY